MANYVVGVRPRSHRAAGINRMRAPTLPNEESKLPSQNLIGNRQKGGTSYRSAPRLKHARLLEGILIRGLAERVGCDESMISKIENGKVAPSLVMLQKLVTAPKRDLSSFFGADTNSPGLVHYDGERPISMTDAIRGGLGVTYERLVPFAAGNLLEGNIHRVEAGGEKVAQITHKEKPSAIFSRENWSSRLKRPPISSGAAIHSSSKTI